MDGISSDVSACVEGRVKKVNDQKAIPFASARVDASTRIRGQKKPSEVFFTRRRKRKDTYAPFSGARLIPYAFQSRKTANANVGKKCLAKRARRPRTSSLRSESSLSLSRRFSASISCAASSAIANANASHYRATAPRASVSFPVVSCVPWMEGKWQTVSYRLGGTFSRSGARAGRRRVVWKAGTRARRWLDVVAARLASPERSNPEVATPRHEPGRVAGRPHSPREALKTTTRTRANE